MNNKCIICEKKAEMSKEHIIPDALGGNITIDFICKDCNSRLGSEIDSFIVNNKIADLMRVKYNIKGKHSKIPNFFKDGLGNDGNKYSYKDGKASIKTKVEKRENTINMIASSKEEAKEIIEKKYKRNEFSKADYDKFMSQINEAKMTKPDENLILEFPFVINMDDINLAMIKIAYEYTYLKIGEEYRNDPIATKIRKILYDAIYNGIRKYDESLILNELHLTTPLVALEGIPLHFLMIGKNNNQIICEIAILLDSEFSEYSIKSKTQYCISVIVSKNADKYIGFKDEYNFVYLKTN